MGSNPQKVKILEAKAFAGKREGKDVDDFLWQMEQYFKAVIIEDDLMKIRIAIKYLRVMATLWGRSLQADRERGSPNAPVLDYWDAFKTELKKYFYLGDAAFRPRVP